MLTVLLLQYKVLPQPTVDSERCGQRGSSGGVIPRAARVVARILEPCGRDDQRAVVREDHVRIGATRDLHAVLQPEDLKSAPKSS